MNNFTTPQDFFKQVTEFYKSVPTTPDAIQDAVVNLTGKVHSVLTTEFENSKSVYETYQRAVTGDATPNELSAARKKSAELFKTATFASMISVPGMLFVLPAVIKTAKDNGFDLVPISVAEQFKI